VYFGFYGVCLLRNINIKYFCESFSTNSHTEDFNENIAKKSIHSLITANYMIFIIDHVYVQLSMWLGLIN